MAQWEGAQLNQAKALLADETTKLLHGEACLADIHKTVATLFGSGGGSSDLESLPKIEISSGADSNTIATVVELLIKAEFAATKSEARRLIKNGGARVNDIKIDVDTATVSKADFDEQGRLKLSSGKKNHVVVVLQWRISISCCQVAL